MPIKAFLTQGVLLNDEVEARLIKKKASHYVLLDEELFKSGLTSPLLKCIDPQKADYVMR